MGNFVGMLLEERLALGVEVIRVITSEDASALIAHLRTQGYGVTSLDAQGAYGHVNVVFTTVNRSHRDEIINAVKRFNPKAFYTIEDVRSVSEGFFLPQQSRSMKIKRFGKKGK